jgi:flagellar biosynthetic protein FliR
MELLQTLLKEFDGERLLAVGFLVLARWLPLTTLAPFFAARAMPMSARIGIALVLSAVVYPAASAAAGPLPLSTLSLSALLVREVLVGALLGLLVAIPLRALEAAGRLVDTARGARMAEVLATPTNVRASPLGAFLLLLGVTLFMTVDGHVLVIRAVGESYRTLPVGAELGPEAPARVASLAIHLTARFFAVALGLAAPVLAAAVLLDLALGIAGRVAPQLPLYFLGLPVKALGGVLLVLLSLPLMLVLLGELYRLVLRTVDAVLSALGG